MERHCPTPPARRGRRRPGPERVGSRSAPNGAGGRADPPSRASGPPFFGMAGSSGSRGLRGAGRLPGSSPRFPGPRPSLFFPFFQQFFQRHQHIGQELGKLLRLRLRQLPGLLLLPDDKQGDPAAELHPNRVVPVPASPPGRGTFPPGLRAATVAGLRIRRTHRASAPYPSRDADGGTLRGPRPGPDLIRPERQRPVVRAAAPVCRADSRGSEPEGALGRLSLCPGFFFLFLGGHSFTTRYHIYRRKRCPLVLFCSNGDFTAFAILIA